MTTIIAPAALALEGGDPRKSGTVATCRPSLTPISPGNAVALEEYMYWAEITRAEEKIVDEGRRRTQAINSDGRTIKSWFGRHTKHEASTLDSNAEHTSSGVSTSNGHTEKVVGTQGPSETSTGMLDRYGISEDDIKSASRAMRTAGWGSIFYLIATDILGPTSTPWAFAQMGYGPGFAIYTVFGAFSFYSSGIMLWKLFLGLDSDRYPIRNYAEIFYRLFGPVTRHLINIGQGIQLIVLLSVFLTNAQAISQMARGRDGTRPETCFVVFLLVFMFAGFIVGQIRTLDRFGTLANFSVWLNVLSMLMIIGLVTKYGPNFGAVAASFGDQWTPGPIRTFAGTPPVGLTTGGEGFVATFNGLVQAVYAFAGAMLFVAFLAEMRRPHDFWKSLLLAEIFLYSVYVVFGMVVYRFHGQFTFLPIAQGISSYEWQTALNTIGLVTNMIVSGMYSNIGMKIVYIEVFQELLGLPPMTTRAGKIWWAVTVPIYWSLGFVIAGAIPQLAMIMSFTGALFAIPFTYTLPGVAAFAYFVQKDEMVAGIETFDPQTRTYQHVDRGLGRLWRGFKKRPFFHSFNMLYSIGGLVACGLGCYASLIQMMAAFEKGTSTSLSCKSPV